LDALLRTQAEQEKWYRCRERLALTASLDQLQWRVASGWGEKKYMVSFKYV
jgi:hypothetical protein